MHRATIPAVILWVEPVGNADFTVKLRAEIVGGLDNNSNLYCQSFRWWLGNGIEMSYDGLCAHAWNADVINDREYEQVVTYDAPGTYEASFEFGPISGTTTVTIP